MQLRRFAPIDVVRHVELQGVNRQREPLADGGVAMAAHDFPRGAQGTAFDDAQRFQLRDRGARRGDRGGRTEAGGSAHGEQLIVHAPGRHEFALGAFVEEGTDFRAVVERDAQ